MRAASPLLVDVTQRLAGICLALPEAYEEAAWTGTRWAVKKKTFAHVAEITDGWPPVYARALGAAGIEAGAKGSETSAIVVTFESAPPELDALRNTDPPFFAPPWRPTIIGLVVDGTAGWDEIAELLTESYLVHAPAKLRQLVDPDR